MRKFSEVTNEAFKDKWKKFWAGPTATYKPIFLEIGADDILYMIANDNERLIKLTTLEFFEFREKLCKAIMKYDAEIGKKFTSGLDITGRELCGEHPAGFGVCFIIGLMKSIYDIQIEIYDDFY